MNKKVYKLQSVQTLRALAVIIVMLLTSATAWADDSGYCGENVIWRLTDEDGDNTKETLTISGSGDMNMAYFVEDVPWLSCRSNTKTVVIESGVTSIGNLAFVDFTNLTSVTIPSSVTSIGNNAFFNCENLTSVTISNGVTSIGNRAFESCTSLTSVTIPASVTSIGERAFFACSSLKKVFMLCDTPPTIVSDVFTSCLISIRVYAKNNPHQEDMTAPLINSYKNGNVMSMMYNWFECVSVTDAIQYIDAMINRVH